MKGSKIPYSAKELEWIKKHKTDMRRKAHLKFCELFGRNDVTLANYNALCKRKGWLTGRDGQFEKGQESWNKGKPMPAHPNSKKTQFKKGREPHNTHYLGHERVTKDGYIEVSVAETNPHTGYERRYVLKHRHEWEKVNGAVPKGHALKCLDGDKTNCDPSNWELIERALLPKLTKKYKFEHLPNEIKPTALVAAKLERKIETMRNEK